MKIELSIIVPIYNIDKYLKQAVDSLINQNGNFYEVILVDDGSTDDCYQICEQYKNDSRVQVIHKKNGGLVSARKAGLAVAHGEFVTFLDGDDWIDADYYSRMLQKIKEEDTEIVCSGYIHEYIDEGEKIEFRNKTESGKYQGQDLEKLKIDIFYNPPFFNFRIIPTVWSKVFRKDMLEKYLNMVPNGITMGEDVVCSLPYILNSKSIYVMNENIGYHYRYVSNSMSNEYSLKRVNQIKKTLSYLSSLIEKNLITDKVIPALNYYVLFMTKEVIKNCAYVENSVENLQEFCQHDMVRNALKEKRGIPIQYRILYKMLYKNKMTLALRYYRLVKRIRG